MSIIEQHKFQGEMIRRFLADEIDVCSEVENPAHLQYLMRLGLYILNINISVMKKLEKIHCGGIGDNFDSTATPSR